MSPPKQALQPLQLHIIQSLSSVFFKFFLFFLYISYLWILGSSPRMTKRKKRPEYTGRFNYVIIVNYEAILNSSLPVPTNCLTASLSSVSVSQFTATVTTSPFWVADNVQP